MSQQAPTEMATPPEDSDPRSGQKGLSKRAMSWLLTGALVVVVIASIFIFNGLANRATTAPTGPSKLLGIDLGSAPAPDITLKDQFGQTVQLSQLQGKPVVLTFFDSYCPHEECPLTAKGLQTAYKSLGKQADQVTWVALSVNPADNPASVAAFLQHNGVTFRLHYLMGTEAQLTPLWNAYHIVSAPDPVLKGVIDHTTYVYIIDQQGHERVVLDAGPGIDPHQITNDVQYLLAR